MILYQEDFYYQNAIIHTTTTNKSFLRMHLLLKKMGIKNNAFFLALTQPELKNIHPHELKDPSPELAARIGLECKINPWYYLREVVRLPPMAGIDTMPFQLHRGNLFLVWTFWNHIDVFLTIPRQTGKTASTIALISGLIYFQTNHFVVTLLTKESDNVRDNVSYLKSIRDCLPKYLMNFSPDDTDNKEGLSYTKLTTQYKTKVARADEAGANNLGRGNTTPCNHLDEVPFCKNIHITYPALISATNKAADLAKQNGQPYTNILTTTAGKLDTEEGRFTRSLIDDACVFHESFYDFKNRDELVEIVKKNSKINMIYGEFSYLQLGYTYEWFIEKSTRSKGTPDEIARDYLNTWTSGGLNNVIPPELLKKIKASQKEVVDTVIVDGYIFRWYESLDKVFDDRYGKRTIIIGLDTSENVGNDFTSLVMIDASDMSVICTARCNDSDLLKLGLYLAEFMIEHPNTILVPERKSTAPMIISVICMKLLEKGIAPFTRIYNQVIQNRDEKLYSDIDIYSPEATEGINKKYLGYTTTGTGATSRDTLYKATLMKAVQMNYDRINDSTLINELASLNVKNGRIDHSTAGHDDTCFVGSTLIRTNKGNVPIAELKVGDLVLTRKGYKPIINIYVREERVISKYNFTGTPSHPFITPDGIVEFKDLTLGSKIYVWNEKLSCIMESRIIDTLIPKVPLLADIIIDMINGKNLLLHFIVKYGKITMVLFQKISAFITKTVIGAITQSRIWNAFRYRNIYIDIQPQIKLDKNKLKNPNKMTILVNGAKKIQKKLINCIVKTVEKVKDWKIGEKTIQILLTKLQLLQEKRQLNYIPKQESLLTNGEEKIQISQKHWLKKIKTNLKNGTITIRNLFMNMLSKLEKHPQKQEERKEKVYNLLVDDCHEYFANDVLVHNCIAYLLACYFVYFGKNFNLYDVDHSTFLNKVSSSGKIVEPEYKQQQDELAERIKDIKRMLSTTSNRLVTDSLTRELRNLEAQIDTDIVDIQPTTVEQMRTNTFKDYVYDPNNLSQFLSLNLN